MADKFGLRAWTINLRAWIFGFTCLVFKTTYIDRRIPLREGAFFFTRRTLFPPLNKSNTHDKAKGKAYHFCEAYQGAGLPISSGKGYLRGLKSDGKKGRIRPRQYGIMSGAWGEGCLSFV